MLKREIKVNFKNFLIWTIILIAIFLVVFLIYPSIINSDNIKMLNEMLKIFPEEILKAFNMDISAIDSAFGWYKTEGFTFILLITGCYAAITGSNILLKEESEKTIEYLNSLPIKRRKIVESKVLAGLIYITLMILSLGVFNYIGLSLSGDFSHKQFILLSIAPIFSSFVIFAFCMFISTFTHKQKKMLGISLGIVFISYILQLLSTLDESVEFLKYASIFTLADTRNIITTMTLNNNLIFLSFILTITFIVLTIFHYAKKELI